MSWEMVAVTKPPKRALCTAMFDAD
jgi:hypothetical protein